ncbi:MAG: virulence-associated E family protein, partial [Bermanella sp.]
QPFVGGETVPAPPPERTGRLTLADCLDRFAFVSPTAEIWDSQAQVAHKKMAFKSLVSTVIYKEWLDHEDRKFITDDEVAIIKGAILRKEIEAKNRNKPAWQNKLAYNDNGTLKADIANANLVLENDKTWEGVLAYCGFSFRLLKLKAPPFRDGVVGEWTETDTARLRIWLSSKYDFTPREADALGAVIVAAESNRFHPVQNYLTALKWDGVKRIDGWLHTYLGVVHTEYSRLVGAMFMVAAVARVMRPPVKVDTVLILEGDQGLGKSTAISILAGEWFTDTPLVLSEKDAMQQLQGVWLIELAELDSLNKADSTKAKQFFAKLVDRFRPSHERLVKEFPRQCIFVGSTNRKDYLRDTTGNRRYHPVHCSKVEKELLAQDRGQLWAEALAMYQEGFQWWPSDKHAHLFVEQQEDRMQSDAWEDLIVSWLSSHTRVEVMMAEMMADALKLDPAHMTRPSENRVGDIMMRLGWPKKRRSKAPRYYYYERPKVVPS